jgi:peptidyl-dipeptidase A
MLELGSSMPWQEAMQQLTGGLTSGMEVQPILDYFEPLREWLENEVKGEKIGWNSDDPMLCPGH